MDHLYSYEVVDVQAVRVRDAASAVRTGTFSNPDYLVACDLLIVGGSMGGVAAALRCLSQKNNSERRLKVCMVEETDWIGGQMTSQGVSALDENRFVEGSGACRSYQQLRGAIRNHYKNSHPLIDEAADDVAFNPGSCWVSWLAFEARVGLEKLTEMLQPALDQSNLTIYTRHKAVYVRLKSGELVCANSAKRKHPINHEVEGVGVLDFYSGKISEFRPRLCLDATELGDLLPLVGLDYTIGSDSRRITGEAHAPVSANPENVQDFTYPFVVEFCPGENHVIEKPARYDDYNAKGKFSFQGYKMFESVARPGIKGDPKEASSWFLPFWEYRRLLAQKNFRDGAVAHDVAMINWDSNDVRGENIVDKGAQAEARRLELGKLISLGFLYWLQTEAPRDDGGKGYPELKLRPDLLDTTDGVAKYPYIRESRRVHTRKTVVESDIVAATNRGARAKSFPDSVGIGLYPVDIHGMQEIEGAAQATKPFQIPLSALLPKQVTNVFPCCKNIGTTHVTNGAYRLHPIEWAIGEAQGALAALLLSKQLSFSCLFEIPSLLYLQKCLVESGAPVYWYDDVPTSHPHFAAVQFLAIAEIMTGADGDLKFRPSDQVTRREASLALAKILPGAGDSSGDSGQAEAWCVMRGVLAPAEQLDDVNLNADDISSISKHLRAPGIENPAGETELTRSEFAAMIYQAATRHLEAAIQV